MDADPGETKDVKEQHPDVVAHLQAIAAKARLDLGDGKKPGPGIRKPGRLGPNDTHLNTTVE
jgi:hypothetical protein